MLEPGNAPYSASHASKAKLWNHVATPERAPLGLRVPAHSCQQMFRKTTRCMQVNLEFLVRDRRTFVTGEAHALKALFGENSSGSASYKLAVATVCSRLSGVFASLKVSGTRRANFPLFCQSCWALRLCADVAVFLTTTSCTSKSCRDHVSHRLEAGISAGDASKSKAAEQPITHGVLS